MMRRFVGLSCVCTTISLVAGVALFANVARADSTSKTVCLSNTVKTGPDVGRVFAILVAPENADKFIARGFSSASCSASALPDSATMQQLCASKISKSYNVDDTFWQKFGITQKELCTTALMTVPDQ